jgi:hypothetical protein
LPEAVFKYFSNSEHFSEVLKAEYQTNLTGLKLQVEGTSPLQCFSKRDFMSFVIPE